MFLILAQNFDERERALKEVLKKEQAPILFFQPEDFKSFLIEIETLPFLSESKAIVLHLIDQLSKDELKQLQKYMANPNAWITLYLTAISLPPQNKVVKLVDHLIEIKKEKPWEKEKRLIAWVIREANASSVNITTSAAQALVQAIDPQFLGSELEKLICFVGKQKEITLDAIHQVSIPVHHETLWKLGDAIFSMNFSLAIKIGMNLIEEEMHFLSLVAHLRTQFHTTLKLLEAFQNGGKPAVSHAFPYLKGGLLDKKIAAVSRYGIVRVKQGIITLFETELKTKNSIINPVLLLEILLLKITNDSLFIAQYTRSC